MQILPQLDVQVCIKMGMRMQYKQQTYHSKDLDYIIPVQCHSLIVIHQLACFLTASWSNFVVLTVVEDLVEDLWCHGNCKLHLQNAAPFDACRYATQCQALQANQ